MVSAFKNPDSCLKSLCQRGEKELRDDVNDVAGMIEDVEEMAILVPQILTQMVERAVDVPQISTDQQTVPMPQVTEQVVDRPYPVSQFRQRTFQ